eukprot:7324660-Prymnesium_polylepis.1
MAQHGAIPGGSASMASVVLSNIVAQGDLPPTRSIWCARSSENDHIYASRRRVCRVANPPGTPLNVLHGGSQVTR